MTTEPIATTFPYLQHDLDRVQRQLAPTVDGYPQITAMLRHLFGAVPKLIRPTLSLMSAYAVDGDEQRPTTARVIDAAALVELMHVGTLCHDDVMDEADTRRGRPSTNAKWGNYLAILAGDYLFGVACEAAATLGSRQTIIVAQTMQALVGGQMIETIDRYNPDRTEQSYYDAARGKSGHMFACACMLGALEAGATDAQVDAFGRFGRAYGVAFQINDDVLDLVQDSQRLGKPAGQDILEGVYTLPVIHAIAAQPCLRAMLAEPLDAAQIRRIHTALEECGAIQTASAVAAEHLGQAVEALTEACESTAKKRRLIEFVTDTLHAVDIYP
jgi:heptaprenyl diphosphate synthase